MPGGIKRAATERARRSAGAHKLDASTREGTRLGGLDNNAQNRIELGGMFRLENGLARLIGLDSVLRVMTLQDHHAAFGIPSKAHCAYPELVLDRSRERSHVLDGIDLARLQVGKIFEQVAHPVGESAHLLLLQRHAGQP